MATQERLFTAAELLALPHDTKRYELVEGQLVEMAPTGESHGLVSMRLGFYVTAFVMPRNLGRVYGAETGFRLAEDPDTVFGIDIAFVSQERLKPVQEGYIEGAPDLAIEIVSPGNTKTEMHEKVQAYFKAGARLVWIVFPKSRTIYVYRSQTDVEILGEEDTLNGGDVLPGFSLKIADIFVVLSDH